jgi:hypothetical protein
MTRSSLLAFSRSLPWQRLGILLALVGMEASWLAPLVVGLQRRSWGASPGWPLLGMAALMLLMIVIAAFLSSRQLESPRYELSILASLILLSLLILRLVLFWGEPALSLRWLADAFITNSRRRLETLLVLATLGYLWWRSVTILQREVGFFTVGYDFRKGVLGLAAGVFIYNALTGRSAVVFIYSFFFFGLIAIAIARAEDKAQVSSRGRPWGPGWLGVVAAASLAMTLFIALLHQVWGRGGFSRAGHVAGPALLALARLLTPVILFLLGLLEPLFEALVAFLQRLLGPLFAAAGEMLPTDLAEGQAIVVAEGETATRSFAWLEPLFLVGLPCLLLAGFLLLLALLLQRRRARSLAAAEDEGRESTGGAEADGLAGWMQARWQRLQELARLLARYGPGRRFYAALSVRHIYANVQRLAAVRGFPRDKAQTANDYLPTLLAAFPGQAAAIAHITAAYNAFEYGHVAADDDELARLHAAWESIRQAGRG